jgi:copper(I)-binding protein
VIRVTAFVVLVAFSASGLAVPVTANHDTPVLATPVITPVEASSAVPISLVIRNEGDQHDRLLGGHTPAAARVEVHRTRLDAGDRVMEVAPDGIAIPAGETLTLEPGHNHLMLLGLQVGLVQGETFPLTITFDRAGEVTVMVRVRRRVDASGLTPFPPVVVGELSISLASAPPAQAETLAVPLNP